MIDTVKVKFFQTVGVVVTVIIVFMLGFSFGHLGHKSSSKKSPVPKSHQVTEGTQLTSTYVKKFLVSYYTKSDLGENRNRYKPYMTEGMYNSTVSQEKEPINQAYKGYVVNFKFESAQIYINEKDHTVITTISYTNDLLKHKNSKKDAQIGFKNRITTKLSYTKVNGKYLVDNMSSLLIADSTKGDNDGTLSYGTVIPGTDDSSTSSSDNITSSDN